MIVIGGHGVCGIRAQPTFFQGLYWVMIAFEDAINEHPFLRVTEGADIRHNGVLPR